MCEDKTDLINIIQTYFPHEYFEYIHRNTIEKYTLIEKNKDTKYSFDISLSSNKDYLIIKHLNKLKERLSFNDNKDYLSKKHLLIKDCDYIIITPDDKKIFCIELKQSKDSETNSEGIKQIKGGIFWLHLIYKSLLLNKKDILNLDSLDSEGWNLTGIILKGKKELRNRCKRKMSGRNIKSTKIGSDSLSFPAYAATLHKCSCTSLETIIKNAHLRH